jgi:hypothetical protein
VNGVRSHCRISAAAIAFDVVIGKPVAADIGPPAGEIAVAGRTVHRGSAAEMSSASGKMPAAEVCAAEMPATASHSSEMRAAEVASASTEVTAAATAMPTATATASAAHAVGCARKRDRECNHGKHLEFRHDGLLRHSPASNSFSKRHNWDDPKSITRPYRVQFRESAAA